MARDLYDEERRLPEAQLDPPEGKVCPRCFALEGVQAVEATLDEYAADGGWVREFLVLHGTELEDWFERGAVNIYGKGEVRECREHAPGRDDDE